MKKVKHARDYIHNKDADVIKHGSGNAINQNHWVKDIGYSACPTGNQTYPDDAWLPTEAKRRPTPHVKVNECDH